MNIDGKDVGEINRLLKAKSGEGAKVTSEAQSL